MYIQTTEEIVLVNLTLSSSSATVTRTVLDLGRTSRNMNGENIDVHALEESLGEHAARLDVESSLDQDTLARVLVIYTGGTIGMMIKAGGLTISALRL